MTRHSKNNTASAVFSAAERDRLEYGIQKGRASKHSFRDFAACHICLQLAVDPVLCTAIHGHLHCRQCLVDSMVAQMDSNKAQLVAYNAWLEAEKRKEETKQAQEKEARIAKFIAEQKHLESRSDLIEPDGKRRAINAYWIHAEATSHDASAKPMEKPDTKIYCLHSTEKHAITLKKLVPVQFHLLSGEESRRPGCPACRKAFKNGMTMAAVTPCGHIFCSECTPKGADQMCLVCEAKVNDAVPFSKEGTGFAAAGGTVEIVKFDIAFQ